MTFDGYLVGHGAAGAEKCRIHAEKGGGSMFKVVDGGVFPEDIVPHLGRSHARPHRWSGFGHRVGAQVDGHAANLQADLEKKTCGTS
jgi:hypothetical protein